MDETLINHIREFNDLIFNSDICKQYQNYIFVYTPTKVGSTTLVTSLRLSILAEFVTIHVHDENMLSILTNYKNVHNITINDIINYNSMIGKNVYVIDIYRTPIERKISEFFENIETFHFNSSVEDLNNFNINKLIKRFNNIFQFIGNGDYFFEKYNNQIDPNQPFDFDNKYLIIQKENITFIKLRLQDSHLWSTILSNIFKREIVIVDDYKTGNKKVGNIYSKFKEEYKIPSNFLSEIQNDKFFIYYNSFEEQQIYLNKWNNQMTDEYKCYTLDEYNLYLEISKENAHTAPTQHLHYLDIGCICSNCSNKRKACFNKVKNGENHNIEIVHDKINTELLAKNKKNMFNIIKQIKRISQNRMGIAPSNKSEGFNMSGIINS